VNTRTLLLGIVGCFLVGGTYSFYKQGVPVYATVITGVLAVLAITGAILWAV
jgi:hypothetical protein